MCLMERSTEKNKPLVSPILVFSPIFIFFSLCSLDKITYSSGGKYECVFETDPEAKRTIEVKSKLINFCSKVRLLYTLLA